MSLTAAATNSRNKQTSNTRVICFDHTRDPTLVHLLAHIVTSIRRTIRTFESAGIKPDAFDRDSLHPSRIHSRRRLHAHLMFIQLMWLEAIVIVCEELGRMTTSLA
jgi:hypothetical protein